MGCWGSVEKGVEEGRVEPSLLRSSLTQTLRLRASNTASGLPGEQQWPKALENRCEIPHCSTDWAALLINWKLVGQERDKETMLAASGSLANYQPFNHTRVLSLSWFPDNPFLLIPRKNNEWSIEESLLGPRFIISLLLQTVSLLIGWWLLGNECSPPHTHTHRLHKGTITVTPQHLDVGEFLFTIGSH